MSADPALARRKPRRGSAPLPPSLGVCAAVQGRSTELSPSGGHSSAGSRRLRGIHSAAGRQSRTEAQCPEPTQGSSPPDARGRSSGAVSGTQAPGWGLGGSSRSGGAPSRRESSPRSLSWRHEFNPCEDEQGISEQQGKSEELFEWGRGQA